MGGHGRLGPPSPLQTLAESPSRAGMFRSMSSPALSLRAFPASPSPQRAGLESLGPGVARLMEDGVKGLYEVKTGLVHVYGRPNKFDPGEGALRAGTRFFATPYRLGRSRWLLLQQLPDDGRIRFSPGAKSTVPEAVSFFASDDVAHNLYSDKAPLPMAPRDKADSSEEDPVWVHDDEQYLRRLRDVHRPIGDVARRRVQSLEADDAIRESSGVVAGGGPLKMALRETKCPKRQRGPMGSLVLTSQSPHSPKATVCHASAKGDYAHINFLRPSHCNLDARYSLH